MRALNTRSIDWKDTHLFTRGVGLGGTLVTVQVTSDQLATAMEFLRDGNAVGVIAVSG